MSKTRSSQPQFPHPRATVLGYDAGIPIVPVTVQRYDRVTQLRISACPYCGRSHYHGGGRPGEDPRNYQGHRTAHCVDLKLSMRGYILRIVETEPRQNSRAGRSTPSRRRVVHVTK